LQSLRQQQQEKWRNYSRDNARHVRTIADLEKAHTSSQNRPNATEDRPRVMTLADISNPNPKGLQYTSAAMEAIGKQALELSNEFRRAQGKHALQWSSLLASIAVVHSKSMSRWCNPNKA
jgi:uncharacterized protein YkwD